jgi:hypothetical protein
MAKLDLVPRTSMSPDDIGYTGASLIAPIRKIPIARKSLWVFIG